MASTRAAQPELGGINGVDRTAKQLIIAIANNMSVAICGADFDTVSVAVSVAVSLLL